MILKMTKKSAKAFNTKKKTNKVPGYKLSAPVAVGMRNQLPKSQFSMGKQSVDGRITVTHREYIGEVGGNSDWGVSGNYAVNPGVGTTFPWLHHMAFQYESYRFLSLKFEFCPSVPTTNPGRVMMFLDYDAADAAPVNKQSFLSNHGAVSGSVWAPLTVVADTKDLHKLPQHTMRYGNLAPNLDIKTYDVANLFVATGGTGPVADVGELYVDYVVEFITPQLNLKAEIEASSAKIGADPATVSKVNPLSNAMAVTGGLPVIQQSGTQFALKEPGEYLFDIIKTGTGLVESTVTAAAALDTASINHVVNAAGSLSQQMYRVSTKNANQTVGINTSSDNSLTGLSIRIAPYLFSLG